MRKLAGAGAVIAWLLYLTHRALGYGFNPDDEMNMFFSLGRPLKLNLESVPFFWNGYIRPLGNLFYLLVYRIFGYWATPFRVTAFLLIAINLLLLFRVAKSLTNDVTAAFLAVLLACFHPEMWDIYASTGTIYDVLCQFFVLLALLVWISPRPRHRWQLETAIALLTVAAVDSKEIGVAIPAILLAHDLLFRPKSIRYMGIAVSSVVAALFLLGRFAQPTALTGHNAYTPVLSGAQFAMTTQWYLNLLLFKPGLSQTGTVTVIAGAFALATLLRNRTMVFGIFFYFLALLPMSFVPVRSGYALYVPQTGALLFLVALFLQLRNRLPAGLRFLRPVATAIFTLCVIGVQFSSNRKLEAAHASPGYMPELEAVANGMRRNFPNLPVGSQVTLVNDPLNDDYVPLFTLRALYNDQSLVVHRIHWSPALGPEQLQGARNVLFFSGMHSWPFGSRDRNGDLVDGRPREKISMSSPLAGWNIVSDVAGEPGPDGRRWAFANPEFVFTRPARRSELAFDYEVPGAVFDQTGPLRLSFTVDGKAPEHLVISMPGPRRYVTSVPAGDDPLVHLKIHAENPYVGADGTKLSFLVSWAGLQ